MARSTPRTKSASVKSSRAKRGTRRRAKGVAARRPAKRRAANPAISALKRFSKLLHSIESSAEKLTAEQRRRLKIAMTHARAVFD